MFPLAIITFTNRNNPTLFFTISLEIRNRATWDQAHCCFLIFPTFSHYFWKKNMFYENFQISWAIDFAVFAFWQIVFVFVIILVPINGLKLDIISMLTFPEICYYAISDLFNAVQRLQGRVQL
ncbi:hypothetical protein T12_10191 [Trichinella patagoniensis]|uniref:Uncharacterized protein n=1 Tax=Trichinella patagoniensis TaxID=990121 RepID=A0A0V0ZXH8_9BILA|nr:hypothetical protein T12_10191 [Trichinella patagoniensis]